MAADSLQLTQKRGRRPRLFGFTGLPESSGSSADSSRQTSPDHTPEATTAETGDSCNSPSSASSSSTVMPSAPSSPVDFVPRRLPVRARSETSLQTVASIASQVTTHAIVPPRRRDTGLKLDFTGIVPLNTPGDLSGGVIASPFSAKLIRKKSGEILKPALKYGGPLAPNGTPMQEPPAPPRTRFESKSVPTTPSCPKYVHFDAQLERVKLFLHDQKPQVVSRDGSPIQENLTSEGEEYPFPSSTDDERDERMVLQIKMPNFPASHPPDADLFLESLFLDDDRRSLRGIVQCRNFAFQKWVAIRFTFDWWQTTSEVTAMHKDSVKGDVYDRFSFLIKLHDILSKIEEKTLFMAIRYNTDGREIWDANGGQNYQVQFERVATIPQRSAVARTKGSIQPGMGRAVGGRTSQWSVTDGNADDRLADLRAKLSRLTADDDLSNSPPQVSPHRDPRAAFNYSPSRRGSANNTGFDSPMDSPRRTLSAFDHRDHRSDHAATGSVLGSRYDFGTALKTTREGRRNSNSPNIHMADLPDVRTGLLQYGAKSNGQRHAATEFYSPRFAPSPATVVNNDHSSDYFFSPLTASPAQVEAATVPNPPDIPDLTVEGPSPDPQDETTPAMPTFEHTLTRRPSLSRSITSPASLIPVPDVALSSSLPKLDPSGPGSATDTPSDSPRSPPDESLPRWSPTSRSESMNDESSLASYSHFIEQCVFHRGDVDFSQD